ncbi:MAG: DUF327 family protein [bacterium]
MRINKSSDKKLKDQLKKWKSGEGEETGEGETIDSQSTDESTFGATVRSQKIKLLDMQVNDLVDEIKQRGNSLVQRPSVSNLNQYKEAMASFLKKAQDMAKQIKKLTGRRSFEDIKEGNEEKTHVIVDTIDEKMDTLTDKLMNREQERIDVNEDVGEIRGLVIDLVSTLEEARPDEG